MELKEYIVVGTTNTGFKSFQIVESFNHAEAVIKFYELEKVGYNFYDKVEAVLKTSILNK